MPERIKNPFIDRFARCDDLEFIRERATVTLPPLTGLSAVPAGVASGKLEAALAETYYASDAACEMIAKILARACAGVTRRHPDPRTFLKTVYSGEFPPAGVDPVCLSGLAGIGKSALLRACTRVLPANSTHSPSKEHGNFPLQSVWHIELDATQTLKPMLSKLANEAGGSNCTAKTNDKFQNLLRRLSYQNGLCLIAVDEFQFVNQGSSANAAVTKMLLSLKAIGAPVVFAANFSLVNRLNKRNHEDQQRLLPHVLTLNRQDARSPDWLGLTQMYFDLAPDIFILEPHAHGDELWCLSGGLPRLLSKLLALAYTIAREEKRTTVKIGDCRTAYRSERFSAMRTEIELLATQTLTGRAPARRADLVAPSVVLGHQLPDAASLIHDKLVEQNAHLNQMNALNRQEAAAYRSIAERSKPKKVSPRYSSDPNSKVEGLEGLRAFKKSLG